MLMIDVPLFNFDCFTLRSGVVQVYLGLLNNRLSPYVTYVDNLRRVIYTKTYTKHVKTTVIMCTNCRVSSFLSCLW